MRIYTRTGDDGTTGLISGPRLPKNHLQLQAIGEIDELNAGLGHAATAETDPDSLILLRSVQARLFNIGANLAAGPAAKDELAASPDPTSVAELERQIDLVDSQLQPLQRFILPGGSELAARLHLARCICRRAERAVVALSHHQPVQPMILAYLNRLSDWLFVMARHANHRAGVEDLPWTP